MLLTRRKPVHVCWLICKTTFRNPSFHNEAIRLPNYQGVSFPKVWLHNRHVYFHLPDFFAFTPQIADSDNDGTDGIDDTVETLHATSLQSKISPKSNSISTIIRSYKSAVTKHANRLGYTFQWQPRFHDHIIRNDKSFQNISAYIMNNPANWQGDKFFNSQRMTQKNQNKYRKNLLGNRRQPAWCHECRFVP